jgi:hypothetical protein
MASPTPTPERDIEDREPEVEDDGAYGFSAAEIEAADQYEDDDQWT